MVEKMMVMMVVGNEEERGDDGGCTVEWIILSCFGVLLPDPLKDKNDLAIVNCRIAFATKKKLGNYINPGQWAETLNLSFCHWPWILAFCHDSKVSLLYPLVFNFICPSKRQFQMHWTYVCIRKHYNHL